jgi:predicted enzyme related to lactoylglutathione lyase
MKTTQKEGRFTPEGRIAWHELHTTDPDAVEAFYGKLFNWKFSPPEEGLRGFRRTIHSGASRLGYLVDLDRESLGASRWLPFMNVSDVDNKLNDISRLGGRIVTPPTEQHGMGTRGIVADNTGACIGLISGVSSDETISEDLPEPGEFLWNDLLSRKPEEAGSFYQGLAGLQLYSMDLGDEGTYYLMRRGEVNEAGILLKPEAAEGPSAWLSYVAVSNVDEACVAAGHLDGAIHIPPRDLHGAGRYAVVGDPSGASLAVFEPTP